MFKLNRIIGNYLQIGNNILRNNNDKHLSNTSFLLFRKNLCMEQKFDSDFEAIADGDEKVLHQLKVLQLEAEVMRQEGRLIPEESFLKEHHWRSVLKLESFSARKRYYEYLFKLSKTKENKQIKKELKKVEREQLLSEKKKAETFEEFVSSYSLQNNSIFLRFYDSTINQMYNNKLIQAIQFGQKLVVDCGYDQQMTERENKNCAKQLTLLFAENRFHDDPFDLHYCNANPKCTLIRALNRHIPQIYDDWFPLNIHSDSYLNHFPKKQLIYLTPDCREEMLEYDHDAVYIIGGIVDKVNNDPLSLAKAKEEGLKMAKLPLDRYLQWGSGSGKNLTLNQVVSILLDVKTTGDWKYALRHVPRRKLMGEPERSQLRKTSGRLAWTPSSNMKFTEIDLNSRKTFQRNNREKIVRKNRVDIKNIIYD